MEKFALFLIGFVALAHGYTPLREPDAGGYPKSTSFLQDVMERINRDMDTDGTFLDFGSKLDELGPVPGVFLPGRATKDTEFLDTGDYDMLLSPGGHISNRDQEYLQHSSLFGHKYMAGGPGVSSLKAKGQKIPTEVKPDAVLPAYCNPPNPCPVDYTAEDGCIEPHSFENTAAFSRAYQASQDCMCDTEHMFDCPILSEADDAELDFSGQQLLSDLQVAGQHKSLVAKKFYNKKSHEDRLSRLNTMAKEAAASVHEGGARPEYNPFLQGDKLPIAAKKGNHALVS